MKQRSEIKRKSKGAYRLSDDVTKLNSDLINKLAKNDQISSAWYFNGHVYGQVGGVMTMWKQKSVTLCSVRIPDKSVPY